MPFVGGTLAHVVAPSVDRAEEDPNGGISPAYSRTEAGIAEIPCREVTPAGVHALVGTQLGPPPVNSAAVVTSDAWLALNVQYTAFTGVPALL